MSENCKSLVLQDTCNIEIFLSTAWYGLGYPMDLKVALQYFALEGVKWIENFIGWESNLKGLCGPSRKEHLKIRPQGYKTFFMLNSTEHKIYHAHKC